MPTNFEFYLPLFPTPYPDEILYSVLCRYHARCSAPSARRTSIELWGNVYGKKLFLPDNIERITKQIPDSANIIAERLIRETTIYPLLKPFLTQERCEALFNAMIFGNPNTYNIAGFSHIQTFGWRYLRYCQQCVQDDCKTYGEPYWHRLHQFPGIFACHKHAAALTESKIEISGINGEYYPLLPAMDGMPINFKPEIIGQLIGVSRETEWLLNNDVTYLCYENTQKYYDIWLRARGYRDYNGKTSHKKLADALIDYYGRDFLSIFDAYNSGACSWTRRIMLDKERLQHPIYHIMLMRFLAGSVDGFFNATESLNIPQHLPYGMPPYPCRNYICEYYLQDVITEIEVVHTQKGAYKATFVCPHCGFTYRRKTPLPKEKQYEGQIDIVEYGWRWNKFVVQRLLTDESPYVIARDVHCDVRTILKFGVDRGLLSQESLIKRKEYVPSDEPRTRLSFAEQRELHRNRWLSAITENPGITRNELRMLDSKSDQWLHLNDMEWYEKNSPPSLKYHPEWVDDEKYMERIEDAMSKIRDAPGRPKRISIAAISKLLGDGKLYRKLASGRLPKSKALIDAKSESLEDWQRRKIIWAVQDMRSRGEVITIYKVRHRATMEDKERRWDDFIQNLI